MPGLTMADQVDGSGSSHVSMAGGAVDLNRPVAGSNMVNGLHDSVMDSKNGTLPNGTKGTMSGDSAKAFDRFDELPPELEHITQGFQPLSKLITRLAQTTFNDLTDIISTTAEMSVGPSNHVKSQNNLSNGSNVNGAGNASPGNIQKKMRLIDFAQDKRAQFIKALVLSDWSRKAEDVSKLIDLKIWLDAQRDHYEMAGVWLGTMKRNLERAKLPNPDIRTALEVLTNGKAPWLPDLGYIPPAPLSPEDMLKALRNINTLLTIRLNLHETIPPPFKRFSISSGRATFHVPGEFEVDLSIAEEDPTSQFYFIDFRFDFTPSTREIPQGKLRDSFDAKANAILEKDGLAGCYSFLHEFVLTHKLQVLRTQARDMARTKWADAIRVENFRRNLVIQYWLNRPGGKSWVELGICSGKSKEGKISREEFVSSEIGLRWFRDGKEVHGESISLELAGLSAEKILQNVIALHTAHLMTSIRDKLVLEPIYADGRLSVSLRTSSTEATDSVLDVQLTSTKQVKFMMEPITGRLAVQTVSAVFLRVENDLNFLKDMAADGHGRIAALRCTIAQQEIDSIASCAGWDSLKTFIPKQDDIRRLFPRETMRLSFLHKRGWSSKWMVCVTIGMAGEKWWIAEMSDVEPNTLLSTQPIPISSSSLPTLVAADSFFSRVERAAAGILSYYVNCRNLSMLRIPHILRPNNGKPDVIHGGVRLPALYIRFSDLMKVERRTLRKSFAKEVLKITFQGITPATGEAVMIVEGRMASSVAKDNVIKDKVDEDIAFHPRSGGFALRLHSSVGEPLIQKLQDRLLGIDRIIGFLDIVKRFSLRCETISLARIVFDYADGLRADIGFSGDSGMMITLDKGNPHLRIQNFLIELLNAVGGLEHVTLLLGITLPLLRALDELEQKRDPLDVVVLPRSADSIRIRYLKLDWNVDIQLRQRKDEVKWFLQTQNSRNKVVDVNFKERLQNLCITRGDGWEGLRTGIVASVNGVSEAIRKLDECVGEIPQSQPVEIVKEDKKEPDNVVVLD